MAKMLVGVPKEIKDSEYRVGLVPSAVRELTRSGHDVLVETNAGLGAGLTDADYLSVGAETLQNEDQIYARSELIVKVKEPLAPERKKLRAGQVLFTYLHLAADPQQTADLMGSGGVAGSHAALISAGMGATVTVIDRNPDALRRVATQLGARVRTVFSTSDAIETLCRRADLVIASVLIPGAAAPKLITAEMVRAMKPGSVIVDIAIDQGGCSETSRPTTHSAPTYIVHDVVHYCVTNMPGAVARTSTFALNNVTLPFVLALAGKGYRRALGEDEHLRNGLNVCEGIVTHRAVAEALKLKFTPPQAALRL